MRPHLAWLLPLPLLLTFHCATGSNPEGEGDESSGAGASGAGGGSGGASTSTSPATSTSTGTGGGSSSASSGTGGSANPCQGVTCTTPPANVCKDSSYLTVNESPGTCVGGNCVYAQHDEWCASGCSNGACNFDPCAGVSCNTPPADYCADPNTLVSYSSPGMCSGGNCTYPTSNVFCSFGCNGGACTGDPCAGVTCTTPPASYCADPNTQVSYGSPGMCSGGNCTYTPSNVPCPFGCVSGACAECTSNGDCPSGEWCNQSQCQPCDTSAHCGPTCVACGGQTPYCLSGMTCVQCLTSGDCPSGQTCGSGNTCVAGCTPPASACTTTGNQDSGCSNPRMMTRTTAGSANGYSQSAYGLCGRANDFPGGGGCNGYGADAEYRLFMRAGESVQTTVTKYGYCNQSVGGNLTLKIFQAACDPACTCAQPSTCPSSARVVCQSGAGSVGQSIQHNYTADKDGWYTFVVDTEITNDNNFQFTMNVKLTCGSGGCACN